MTHDDLLNIYFPKTDLRVPDYVTPAPPMPQQEPLPQFMSQQAAPPPNSVGQGGGGGGSGGGDLMKILPTLLSIFML
jgi:hypothetical protein